MIGFIETNGGLVNLAHVQRITRQSGKSEQLALYGADGVLIDRTWHAAFDNTVLQLLPVSQPYDSLHVLFEDRDGKAEPIVLVDDVIAWALMADGLIYPVEAGSLRPRSDTDSALRRRGQEVIEVVADATYENEAAWLKSCLADEIKKRESEAAKSSPPGRPHE